MDIADGILDILLAFGGPQGGQPGHTAVRFLLPSFFWTALALAAFREWRRTGESKDRFIGIAAAIGLSRELLMFAAEYGTSLGLVAFDVLYPFYPPFEHAATMLSGAFIAAAFINYVLDRPAFSRSFLTAASAATILLYAATAALWPVFLLNHPGSAFGLFWGDMAFRVTATVFLSIVLSALLQARMRGVRVQIPLLLGFLLLLLDELLMVANLLTAERYVSVYAPIRHNLHIWAIPLFLGVYWSDLNFRLQRALNDIREERHFSQGIIAAIGDGITVQSREFRILYQNQIHKNMVGEHEGELCYKAFENHGVACRDCPVQLTMEDGKVHRGERRVDIAGAALQIEITASPVRDAEGRIIAAIEVVRDVTERKRLSEEMAKTEKLESVGLLAGGLAHDFNNLLTGIFGNISLARMHAEGNELVNEPLGEAEKASLRASELTRQLLTFAKGGVPIKKPQPIAGIIVEAVKFTLAGSRVKAAFDLPDDIPLLDVDAGQMHQVFNNLVMNAVQAMPNGGVLTVKAAPERIAAGGLSRLPLSAGDYVRISLADTGSGIAAELLPRIFDPYFTTKETGTGLGLATVYSIVKKHGGSVTADSAPGSGAVFDIYLPVSSGNAALPNHGKQTIRTGAGNILVMDDEQLILDTAGRMLKALGYRFSCAKDGAEAVSLYRAAHRSNSPYDAVILDLTVPGGVGGKEAVQQLLALDPNALAIVSSGYSNDPVMADHMKHGFRGMLAKPYDADTLGRAIREVMTV